MGEDVNNMLIVNLLSGTEYSVKVIASYTTGSSEALTGRAKTCKYIINFYFFYCESFDAMLTHAEFNTNVLDKSVWFIKLTAQLRKPEGYQIILESVVAQTLYSLQLIRRVSSESRESIINE